MSTEKTPQDQITEAGAVELNEGQLDDAAGGVIAISPAALKFKAPELKINTSSLPGDGSVRTGDGSV